MISRIEENVKLNSDYLTVYRADEEYKLMIEYRKLNRDQRNRLIGYLHALVDEE